ncbi:MAG: ABC transporter permease [Proteobacteria bacterium]|nr:ABC transporter permease [Pseudomonadota bacterium]
MAGEPVKAGGEAAGPRGFDLVDFLGRFAPLIFLLVLIIGFTILEPRFLHPLNLFNVMRQVSITGIIAIGMTFVILTAGIDLSVGSLLALTGLVAAAVAKGGFADRFAFTAAQEAIGGGMMLAALAAMAVGLAGGLLQGLAVTRLAVPPFVVTLGGLSAFRGAALLFAGGGPISGFGPAYRWWGQGKIGEVPVPVIIFLGLAIIAHIVLRYTRFGRNIYAVGGNPEAARLSGLNVRAHITSVYVIVGVFAGLAGFVLSSRLNSAEAVAGLGYELTVIAAVVIGGTSLFGGIGGIFGTVVGATLIGVLINGLVLMNVSSYIQQIVIGVIIVLAVAFDRFVKSKRRA